MTMTADILTPAWSIDSGETSQPRIPLSLVEGSGSLKIVPHNIGSSGDEFSSRPMPVRDWTKLIDLVQNAARHARDLETRAQDQELRVQELLQRVREDIRRAAEQVRVAEMRAREAEAQAEGTVAAAEERARAAEARAQTAEEWLIRVQDAIVNGFAEPVAKAGGA